MALFLIFSGTFCHPCRELEANGFYDQIRSLCDQYDNVTFKMIKFDQWGEYVPRDHPRYSFYKKIVKCTPIFIIVDKESHDNPSVDDLTLLKSTSIFNMTIVDGIVEFNKDTIKCTIENIKDFIENSSVFNKIFNIKEPAI